MVLPLENKGEKKRLRKLKGGFYIKDITLKMCLTRYQKRDLDNEAKWMFYEP